MRLCLHYFQPLSQVVVLGTDGLFDNLWDKQLIQIVTDILQVCLDLLVDTANSCSGSMIEVPSVALLPLLPVHASDPHDRLHNVFIF